MTPITRSQLEQLAREHHPWCVSLYLGTHPAGMEVRQDPIRLKNLLRDAERQLTEVGVRSSDARHQLDAAQDMLSDSGLWRNVSEGLAVFVGPEGDPRVFQTPMPFEELAVVAPRFHVKPLLPLVASDAYFYILALSQDSVRLFRATQNAVEPVEMIDTPRSLLDTTRYDDLEQQQQWHTQTGFHQPGADRPAVFHGHGVAADERDQKRRVYSEYCHRINHGLRRTLRDERAPLILATTEPLLGVFRQNSQYPGLVEAVIDGSPDQWDAGELHRRAAEPMAELFEQGRDAAIADFLRFEGGPRASSDVRQVAHAAAQSQVAELLVAVNEHRWGTFDDGQREADVHEDHRAGDYDLLDLAASMAFQTGAQVFAIPSDQMPNQTVIAATYRFASPA